MILFSESTWAPDLPTAKTLHAQNRSHAGSRQNFFHMQCCGAGRKRRRESLQRRLERANAAATRQAPAADDPSPAAPLDVVREAVELPSSKPQHSQPAALPAGPSVQPAHPAGPPAPPARLLEPLGEMLEGLPPTLPPAVARLFLKKPDARLDQHETAEVVQREQQFYKHEAVVRAGKLIDRYIAREEAALLIGAAWKMVRLRREAQALTRRSLRELKDAASLDEDLEVARESMRESGRSGRGSDDAEEQLATSADGKGEAGVHSAIAAVFASRTAPRVPERPKAVDQRGEVRAPRIQAWRSTSRGTLARLFSRPRKKRPRRESAAVPLARSPIDRSHQPGLIAAGGACAPKG